MKVIPHDARRLKARLRKVMTLVKAAEKLGMPYQTLTHKLAGFATLYSGEAIRIEALITKHS